MYEILTGPVLWLAFGVCFVGLLWRVVTYIMGLNWALDRVAYRAHPGAGMRGAVKSVVAFLLPYGNHSWRAKPVYTVVFFLFHIGIVMCALFAVGHATLLKNSWGISWPSMSTAAANFWTVTVIVTGILIAARRFALPEVRIITTFYDYFLLALTLAPFVTGLLAVNQIGDYKFWVLAHVISGELVLVALPFTKLYHVVGFFLSRAQIGADYGIKRGGMKTRGNKGMVW